MTTKKALPDDITKFFQGESVFFQGATGEESISAVQVHVPKKKAKGTRPPQAIAVSSSHAAMQPRHHDTVTPAMIETVRKAVKQIGKEAATHRFTEEEKRAIADIVYTYERQKLRTSENEITRIAVNWLLLDYAEQGKKSILVRLLGALHE